VKARRRVEQKMRVSMDSPGRGCFSVRWEEVNKCCLRQGTRFGF
jgi:hypothetical protein